MRESGSFAARCRAPSCVLPRKREDGVAARPWMDAPSGAPPPSFMREAKLGFVLFVVVVGKPRTHQRRENGFLFHLSPRAGRGRVSGANEGEGALPRF
jgi:hypothetical protein